MSATGLAVFDETLHITNAWLKDLMELLGWEEREYAYRALRVTLHALRDRMPVDNTSSLAAQLPMLVRGFFYEGWHPAGTPTRDRSQADFVAHVAKAFERTPDRDPDKIVRAVFTLLTQRLTLGEVEHVKKCLPADIRGLWPR